MAAKRKYEVNDYFFDRIDSFKNAYVLGFIYGDGYNSQDTRTLEISLSFKDASFLQMINDFIQPSRPLGFLDRPIKGKFCRMRVTSQKISDDLAKWGCPQKKTFLITWPEWLDPKLWSSFLRGMWDSDGTIGKSSAELVTTLSCAEWIKKILNELLGLNFSIYRYKRKNGEFSGIVRIGISGRNVTRKFLDWLYENSDTTIRLDRKYLKYLEIKNYIKPPVYNKSRKENGELLTKEERAQQRREIELARYYQNKSPLTKFVPRLKNEDGSPLTEDQKRLRRKEKQRECDKKRRNPS